MADIIAAKEMLIAGQHITHKTMKFNNTSFFLKASGKRTYLFMRSIKHTGEVVESPAVLDWDDLISTTWRTA